MGKENLGFEPHEIGTHSIRSGAAMAMSSVTVVSNANRLRWFTSQASQ